MEAPPPGAAATNPGMPPVPRRRHRPRWKRARLVVGMALVGVAVALGFTGAFVRSNGRPTAAACARVAKSSALIEADPNPKTQNPNHNRTGR